MTIYVKAVTLILTEVERLLDTPSALEVGKSKGVVYWTGLNGAFRRYIYGGRRVSPTTTAAGRREECMQATAEGQQEALTPQAKSAIRGAWVGFFVDMFDIYLPIVVLAPALIYFVSPDLSAATTAIVGGSIFAATLIGRPLGASDLRALRG